MWLQVTVMEAKKQVLKTRLKVMGIEQKFLTKVQIPGFTSHHIEMLVRARTVEYRHLGLDYKIEAIN